MYILIILQLINSIILVRNPDELFTHSDREPYMITARKVTLDEQENNEGKVTHLMGNVKITHGVTVITGDEGYAYEKDQSAEIIGNVTIDDEGTIITSNKAKYYKDLRMAIAVDSVNVRDNNQLLKADSIVYFKEKKFSQAWGNVVLIDEKQNTEVTGDHGEFDFLTEVGFITQNPVLKLKEKEKEIAITGDTLKIKRKENFMSCTGNVKIVEDSITAKAGYLEYFQDSDMIYLKEEPLIEQQGKSTLSGHLIEVFLKKREIVKTTATINAKGEYNVSRGGSNTVSGDSITIYFDKGKTERLVVKGNAVGMYKKVITKEKKSE